MAEAKPYDPLSVTVLGHGYFDRTEHVGDAIVIAGWMLVPDLEFDRFQLYFDRRPIDVPNRSLEREGVGAKFPEIEHAKRSGFVFRLQKADFVDRLPESGRLDLIGWRGSEPVARISTFFRADLNVAAPTPPPALMTRVVGAAPTEDPDRNAMWFKLGGLKGFSEFTDAVAPHRELGSFGRMLDWGCGCGRITVHFLALPNGPNVSGCDIDGEAIAWCSDNLSEGTFTQVEPIPPTPYGDASFDLVISYSVFTHLTEDAQTSWLKEMQRIIEPGGLFLASTHGETSASVRSREQQTLVNKGIDDTAEDTALSGIAPEDYYRQTLQTREYTLESFGRFFEVLDYIERGIGNVQDLVVMRRPAEEPVSE